MGFSHHNTEPFGSQNVPQHLTAIKILYGDKNLSGLPCGDHWENTCFPCLIHFIFVCVPFSNFKIYWDNTYPVQHIWVTNLLV